MRRGTTPTIQLTADNMSFKDCSLIIVTMKSKDKTIVEKNSLGVQESMKMKILKKNSYSLL